MNKITAIETVAFCDGRIDRLVVIVDTESGHSGIGEAGLTGRERAVIGAIEHLRPLLLGEDAGRIEHLWQLVSRGGFFPAGPVVAAAQSAIDIALWDVLGKRLGVPVYELLGGRTRDKVVCYPHNAQVDDDVDRLVESALATVAAGWKFVRWGLPLQGATITPRHAVDLGIRQLAAVRQAVGDEIEICIDLHTRLDPSDALRFCREAEAYRPFFVEDPVRAENHTALRHLRQHTAVPIAAGEQLSSKWHFRPLLEEHLIDFARIDLCLVGGFTEARKVAALAEIHYINIATHNPLGPVSSAACLHLNLACSNVAVQEQPALPQSDPVIARLFPMQMRWEDGYLLPPTAPGLGVEFDRDAAAAYPPRGLGLPTLTRSDGSFTNW